MYFLNGCCNTTDAKYYTKDFSGYSAGDTTWKIIGTTMDPYMVGPALDPENGSVYFITRTCATARRKLLGGYICNKKGCSSMKNQIKPSGTQDTQSCSNSSFTYAINRYNYGSKTYDLLYSEKVKIADSVSVRSFQICVHTFAPFCQDTPRLCGSQNFMCHYHSGRRQLRNVWRDSFNHVPRAHAEALLG